MDSQKFRLWNKTVGEYITHCPILLESDGSIWLNLGDSEDRLKSVVAENVILEKCTGLKDMNDTLIHAGDIVTFTIWWFDGNVAETQLTGTIVYSPDLMSFQLKGVKNKEWESHTGYVGDEQYLTPFSELNFEEADFEVIGNVNQNAELLEV